MHDKMKPQTDKEFTCHVKQCSKKAAESKKAHDAATAVPTDKVSITEAMASIRGSRRAQLHTCVTCGI